MRILLTGSITLALAACSQDEVAPVDNDLVVENEGETEVRSVADEADSGPTRAGDDGTAPGAIPTAFHGVWDFAEGTCDRASDLRLDVGARRIEFYESVGQVTGVRAQDDGAIIVDLAMEGEGETWEQSSRLEIADDGKTLTFDDAADPENSRYSIRKRCPNAS